jgi:hypothetical protein
MAGRNSWIVQGNGILGGLALGTGRSDPNDVNAEYESPWMQAFRQTLKNPSGGNPEGSDYSANYQSPQPSFGGASVVDTAWAPFALGAGPAPRQMAWPSFSPSASLTNALAPMQRAPDFAAKFAPLLPPDARSGGGPAMQQNGGWPNPSTLDQLPSNTGSVPVGFRIPMPGRRPLGPPSVPGPVTDDLIKGMQWLFNYFRSPPSSGTSRGGDDEDCFDRWERELKRCRDFIGRLKDPRWLDACNKRANARHNLCVSNGGKPRPDEPDEFGLQDIPNDPAGR